LSDFLKHASISKSSKTIFYAFKPFQNLSKKMRSFYNDIKEKIFADKIETMRLNF